MPYPNRLSKLAGNGGYGFDLPVEPLYTVSLRQAVPELAEG
jgi:hypothetical protein